MAKTATAPKKGAEQVKPSSEAASDLRELFEDQLKDILLG